MRKVEVLLEEILEGQRLTRLDTLMLLAFPLLIFGFSQLNSVVANYRDLSQLGVFGTTLGAVIPASLSLFVVGDLTVCVLFIRSYLQDSIFGRVRAFVWAICLSIAILSIYVNALSRLLVPQILQRYSSNPFISSLPVIFSAMMFPTMIFLSLVANRVFAEGMSRWLRNNAPRKMMAEGVQFHLSSTSDFLLVGKGFWTSTIIIYAAIVVLGVAADGLRLGVAIHVLALTALVLVTIVAFYPKKETSKIGS